MLAILFLLKTIHRNRCLLLLHAVIGLLFLTYLAIAPKTVLALNFKTT